MAIKIQLKKIKEDGYEEPFDFEIGSLKAPLSINGTNYGEHSLFSVQGETRIQGGTDLSVLYGQPGDKWQAFNGDEKLGFIIQYVGQDGSSKEIFAIYNEEIQAGCLYKIYTSDRSRPVRMAINYPYVGETLNDCLNNAKFLYDRHMEQFKQGFANNKNSFFVLMSFSGDSWYGNEFINNEGVEVYPKMRYFSSVYKLITGEFYEKDKMFAMTLNNGDKFYFGRVIEYTNRSVRDGRISDFASNVRDDPSYVFTDLVYGSSVGGYLQKRWGENVEFSNGTRMAFANPQWNAGTYNKSFYPEFVKIGDEGNYKINWKIDNWGGWTGPDGKSGFNNIYLSKFQPLIEENTISSFGTSYDCQGVDIFISPQYNDFDYKSFVDTLKEQTYTEDQWKKLLARVFTFASTIRTKLSGELQTEYDYVTNNFTQVCFTGWAGFIERDTRICTNAVPNDRILVNTFTSADKWGAVVKFVDPKDPEPVPPGPGPGPEPEPEEDKDINIGNLAELSIKKGLPFLGDYEKLDKYEFMQEYLEDFTDFDYDIMESRGFFIPVCEQETLEKTLDIWRRRAAFTIKKHANELAKLWELKEAVYDPIMNVEEHIDEVTKKTGSDTLRDAIDSVTTTNNYGAKKNTDTYGKQETSITQGSQDNSDTIGAKTTTTENDRSAMGPTSSVYGKEGKSTTNEGSQSNSSHIGGRTDSSTVQSRSDIHESDAAIDTQHTDYREDVHEQTYDSQDERKMTRVGNIGVMSAQELALKQKDAIDEQAFDFYNNLYSLLIKELAYYVK